MGTAGLKRAEVINSSVSTERVGGVGWIILNRPDQINAINDEIRTGVPQALRAFDRDDDIGAIVIRGEGYRGFCAGADIKEQRGPETSIEVRQRMEQTRWIEAVDEIQKPVVAAIHGYCMGGGMELALACDIRFASPDLVMSLPETGLGLIPGGGGTQRLPRIVGLAKALDMMLTGVRVKVEEALSIGLVTRVATSADTLLEEVGELAAAIASRPPVATRYVRRAARAALELEFEKGLDLELDLFALLKTSEDAREAASAFKEKRTPRFTGK
jgi:enoyl-CoA hydratase